MAIGWFSTGSNPACLFYLNATASRSGSTVTINYTIKAKLGGSGSILGTSGTSKLYWIKVKVEAGGASTTVTVKKDNGPNDYDYWSGTTEHTKTGKLTFTNTTSTSTSVKFTGTSGMTSTGKFSAKSMTVSFPAYTTRPGSARNLSISPTTIPTTGSFNASWTAPSSNGGAAINRYELELKRYDSLNGTYSSYTDGNVVVDASGGSIATYKNGVYPSSYYTLNAYDSIYCRLATRNSVGWDDANNRPEIEIHICDIPGSIYPIINTDSIKSEDYFYVRWDPPSNNNASIDKYRVQISKYNTDIWYTVQDNVTTTSSNNIYPSNYLTLADGDIIACRVLAHNVAGWATNYGVCFAKINNPENLKFKDSSGNVQSVSAVKYKDTSGNIKDAQIRFKDSGGSVFEIRFN